MKLYDYLMNFKKEGVYDIYSRVCFNCKWYTSITKKKMVEEIVKLYQEPKVLINLCTAKELKMIEKLIKLHGLDPKKSEKLLMNNLELFYTLSSKGLVNVLFSDKPMLFEDIIDAQKKIFKVVDWDNVALNDRINEFLVGFYKILGKLLIDVAANLTSDVLGIKREYIDKHIEYNMLFNFYVFKIHETLPSFEQPQLFGIYIDYEDYLDELSEKRRLQASTGQMKLDLNVVRNIFYYDYDIDNPTVAKIINAFKADYFGYLAIRKSIQISVLLNDDRHLVKNLLRRVITNDRRYQKICAALDEAMDEMPSGALNGLTANEAKSKRDKQTRLNIEKSKLNVKQKNANLSQKDADLFYKIYFGLLDYTNKKYKINLSLKIYQAQGINPQQLAEVIKKFWDEKNTVITEFCLKNPYNFTKEELKIASDFKKGFRDVMFIARFFEKYTAIVHNEDLYMVKGIRTNIDVIINKLDLPMIVIMALVPFKNMIVFDSIMQQIPIGIDGDMQEYVENIVQTAEKIYKLD